MCYRATNIHTIVSCALHSDGCIISLGRLPIFSYRLKTDNARETKKKKKKKETKKNRRTIAHCVFTVKPRNSHESDSTAVVACHHAHPYHSFCLCFLTRVSADWPHISQMWLVNRLITATKWTLIASVQLQECDKVRQKRCDDFQPCQHPVRI